MKEAPKYTPWGVCVYCLQTVEIREGEISTDCIRHVGSTLAWGYCPEALDQKRRSGATDREILDRLGRIETLLTALSKPKILFAESEPKGWNEF